MRKTRRLWISIAMIALSAAGTERTVARGSDFNGAEYEGNAKEGELVLSPSEPRLASQRSVLEEGADCVSGCRDCFAPCCCGPLWEARAAAVFLKRDNPDPASYITGSDEREIFNFSQFSFDYEPGVDVSLIRHLDSGDSIELRYLGVWDTGDHIVSPTYPGGDVYYNTNPVTAAYFAGNTILTTDYDSEFHSAEINLGSPRFGAINFLMGFRYLRLNERFVANFDFIDTPGAYANWDAHVTNDLYGVQVGGEGVLLSRGRLQVQGAGRAGLCGIHAQHTLNWRSVDPSNPSGDNNTAGLAHENDVAFIGEVGLTGQYQLYRNLAVFAGYQLLWLDGVATASGQIKSTPDVFPYLPLPASIPRFGINSNSDVFYQGFNVGVEFRR